MAADDLSAAEKSLWAAFPSGAWLDLRPGIPGNGTAGADGPGRGQEVRAAIIAGLLLGAGQPAAGSFPAIRLRGVRVTGRLDLMGATVTCALVCEECHFDEPVRFVEATTRTVRIVGSQLPGFNGARMRADGILNFHRSTVATVLRLDGARISGELCTDHATLGSGTGEIALAGEDLTVDGPLNCRGTAVLGAVSLRGAHVSGTVDATAATVTAPGSVAIDANHATIGGVFCGERITVTGETRLRHARIGASLDLAGARLSNPGGSALGCGGLAVEGGVWLPGAEADGQLRFIGARVGGNLSVTGATLSNPGGLALNLDRAALGDFDGAGLTVREGQVSLVNAQVAAQVTFAGAELTASPGQPALVADGCVTGAGVDLAGLRARGEVKMRTCRIGGRLHLTAASIENPGGSALRLSRTEIAADAFCGGMTVSGQLKLTRARVGGHAKLEQVTLSNPGGVALDAEALQAAEFSLLPATAIEGTVLLSHAQFGVLRDDPAAWPAGLQLDGLTYSALEPPLPAPQRLDWLAAGTADHQLQPYEQLAALYTRTGQPAETLRVLYAKERHLRATKTPLGRLWSVLQDITIGYGYRPWRAALWLALLLAAGTAVFARHPYPPHVSGAPHFLPFIYTLDLLLPIITFGQKSAYNPTGFEEWLSYLLMAAGWLLASTIATAIARVIRRQ